MKGIRSLINQSSINEERNARILKRVKLFIQVALFASAFFSLLLFLAVATGIDQDYSDSPSVLGIMIMYIGYAAFYLFIYAVIPCAFLMIAIAIYNRYRNKPNWPFLKIPVILLCINVALMILFLLAVFFLYQAD